ncbi:MAG: DUF1553 domain-containing protein [Bryobacteraceae bacterium]
MRFALRVFTGIVSATLCLAADCSFRAEPERFLGREASARRAVSDAFPKLRTLAQGHTVDPVGVPRINLIDEAIFGELAKLGVPSARLSGDEVFLRRVSYDLTGRPPTPERIRAFLEDSNPEKRASVIHELLNSQEFVDKWTMWLGDLFQNVVFPQNFDRQYAGRNAFYFWMVASVADGKSLRDMALEAVGGQGNSYDSETGGVNFVLNGISATGPVQDTYDSMAKVTAQTFLGMSHYDCLLCHDGRRHLDLVSAWGAQSTRLDAQRMAAFFARTTFAKPRVASTDRYYNSYNVAEADRGVYSLSTNFGNRPDRVPFDGNPILAPEYRDGRKPDEGQGLRAAFARMMVDDPMFAINFANRLWREMFTIGLVEPVDALDPARLDPANPPPEPWSLQATHPELLRKLAGELAARNFNLREFLRLLAESSAYQLSSRYDDTWKLDYVPLFARHFPRRLEGEEVHDTIVQATGIQTPYVLRDLPSTPWAMQLPDPIEPRNDGAAFRFMTPFFRGNRDSFFRIQDGSIQQQLALMNDTWVVNRLRASASGKLRAVAAIESDDEAVDELFLLLLQRTPDLREKSVALAFLSRAAGRRTEFIEDLAWGLVNKTDFLFNY